MNRGSRQAVRCLAVGQFPTPDLELIRQSIPAGQAELVLTEVGEDLARLGRFDMIWRLMPAEVDGVAHDQLAIALETHPEVDRVHTVSAGIDHLAALFADRPNIILTHSAGVTAIPIAEFVVGCLLQHCKRVAELADLQRERRFVQLTLRELGDMRVVLLGLGAIGSEVARRLAPLRLPGGWGPAGSLAADSSRCDPSLRIPGFGAVLQGRRCPNSGGTPNPRHRAGGERRGIGRACRGERAGERGPGRLVDEAALLAAVSAGRPVAAYLDAFVEEPLPDGSPLWTAPGVHVSPHLSWSSSHLARRTSDLFAGQLRRWLAGEPLRNRADPGAGY